MPARRTDDAELAADRVEDVERMLTAYRQALSHNIRLRAEAAPPTLPSTVHEVNLEPVRSVRTQD